MEGVNCLESVDVPGVSPIGDVVAGPFDRILELSVPDFGVLHFFNLPFLFSIDLHWWR